MTSSERHLKPGEPRWDFGKQVYKNDVDVFVESGLFSIIFIAHGRPKVSRRSLLSTYGALSQYPGEVEWIFIENGEDDTNYSFFQEIKLERKVVVRQKNFGINEALNQGWALSRGQFCLIHENDWECQVSTEFLSAARDIFKEQPDVGIIQLRNAFDPNENHGRGKPEYNPWSCTNEQLEKSGTKVFQECTEEGHNYLMCEFPNGFNNNPILMRKSLYRECGPYPESPIGGDPRHGETEYQERVAKSGCAVAYIGLPIYSHIGRVQSVIK